VKSASKTYVPRVHGVEWPEDSSEAPTIGKRGQRTCAGSLYTACPKKMTQEPGRPVRSVENRRPKARETKAWAECVAGVGGPYRSCDAGERRTPDPAERRG